MVSKDGVPGGPDLSGWFPKCSLCGAELPLLHPHIMVEKTDADGEPICEECHAKLP